jgi:hypothetical protein
MSEVKGNLSSIVCHLDSSDVKTGEKTHVLLRGDSDSDENAIQNDLEDG